MLAVRGLCLLLFAFPLQSESQSVISGSVTPGGVQVPSSPCPGMFEYIWWRNEVVGLANIPPPQRSTRNDPIQLLITLAMKSFAPSEYAGEVELVESKNTVVARLQAGDRTPISYRIRFPVQTSVPMISNLQINGQTVCQGHRSSGSVTILTLNHSLKPDGSTSSQQPAAQQTWQQPQAPQKPWQQPQQPEQPWQQPAPQQPEQPWKQPIPQQPEQPWQQPQQPEQPWQQPTPQQPEQPWQQPAPQQTWQQPTTTQVQNPVSAVPAQQFVSQQTRPPSNPSLIRPTFGQGGGIDECGQPVGVVVPLLVNGSPTLKGQWPWLAAIFIKTNVGQDFQCGGSLVSTSHVVTAAHCIKDPNKAAITPDQVIIYVGKYNLRRAEPESQPRDVSRFSLHPSYGSGKYDNDIAVIFLESPVQITASVRPVCLWPESKPQLDHILSKRGTVVGWGRDENGNRITDVPKMVNMPLVTQEECLRSHRNYYYLTSDNTFCAGGRDGAGPCNGDSGGGMYFSERTSDGSTRWMLRGVVSLSLQDENTRMCDLTNFIVFTDVAKYIPWVKSVMGTF